MKKRLLLLLFVMVLVVFGCAVEEIPETIEETVSTQEVVAEDISHVQEDFEEFVEEAAEEHIEVSADFIYQFNSLLDLAIKELEQDNFAEARKLVRQAETLLEDEGNDAFDDEGDDIDPEEKQMLAYWQSIWNPSIEAAFSEKQCDTSKKPFEYNLEPYHKGPAPDTYLVSVSVETTSPWTNVDVDGLQSLTTAGYISHQVVDWNVGEQGLRVELSDPKAGLRQMTAEFDAIVQKEGNTAIFRIDKDDSGTTTYKLFHGNSEIANFVHNGQGVKKFNLNLNLLSSPLDLPNEQYDGPLFDAHLHLVGSDLPDNGGFETTRLFINPNNADEMFAMMDAQGVTGMIGFLPINHENFIPAQAFNDLILAPAAAVVKRSCERIIPFLHPDSMIGIPPNTLSHELPKLIDQGYIEYPIPFRGIGEVHTNFPYDLYANVRLLDPAMFELYDYAADNNLVVMIHPREIDLEDLDVALGYNPNTKLLLHGDEGIEKIIPPLMEKHDNLYFSIDAGLMYPYSVPVDGMTKENFLNNVQSNGMYNRILASALHYWGPLIEAHPDRILWGTDVLSTWHFEVYPELTQFARDFIGGLDPAVQEKFAYKNAEELIAKKS